MATIGNINIGMTVGTANLQRGLNQARGQMQSFASSTSIVKSALAGLGIGLGFGAIAGGVYKAVTAASDLKEQTSKASVVFGAASSVILEDAQKMADAFGIPKTEFIEGATNIGQLGKAAGLGAGEAAAFGDKFAKMALDVSSFQNVSNEDALRAIRSGLSGESEPLKRLGVLMDEDAVKREAARLGIAKYGTELTNNQKVMARASFITKSFADAQGDLERTSGGAANMMRAIGGRATNLAADIGTAIAPLTDMILKGVDDTLKWGQGFVNWGGMASGTVSSVVAHIQEFPLHWQIAADQFSLGALAMIEWIKVLPQNLSIFGNYLANNWTQLISDGLTGAATIFMNFATNIQNAWQAVMTYLQGGEFNFNWTPLLTGFKATADQLPEFVKPAVTDSMKVLQDGIDTKQKQLETNVAARKAASEAAAAAATAAEPKTAQLDDIHKESKKKEKLLAGAVDFGSKEANSAILTNRMGAEKDGIKTVAKTGKEQLAEMKRQTQELKAISANKAGLTEQPI